MYSFYSTLKHPVITLKPMKTNRDGDVLQEPIRVRFEDKFFATDSEEIAVAIRKLPNFGADYFEIDETTKIPKDVGYHGNQVGIHKMDSPKDQEANKVVQLETQIATLSRIVGQLVEKLNTPPSLGAVEKVTENETEETPKKLGRPKKETTEEQA